MSLLFIVSGASGVGKSTLCKRMLQTFPGLGLSISTTTRAPRGQEQDGKEYFFVSRDSFQARIEQGDFAEWAEVHGNLYGTSREVLDAAMAAGQDLLFDIDYQGAASLMAAYPEHAVSTMVLPPNMETLEERLRGRGTDSEEVIRARLHKALEEISHAPSFHHLVVNQDLDRAFDELSAILSAARSRASAVWPRVRDRY